MIATATDPQQIAALAALGIRTLGARPEGGWKGGATHASSHASAVATSGVAQMPAYHS
ncbi:hypothetical protein GCM10007320_16890 [Pseudorhodoferax aquiterrae]|uniref:Uncharacterized protein n=1 Tax=Pseudorhodoferax aquiterrae TaxID=747304 RepID=A0ABQ3FZT7_9BURK|nr:hypothetical protein GCM10007320_16890 [Pseudorhodoferax aquiterrae]